MEILQNIIGLITNKLLIILFFFTSFELHAQKAKLNIESIPSGAKVYLNEQFYGNTPITLEVNCGEYHLIVRQDIEDNQYLVAERNINLSTCNDKYVSLNLAKNNPNNKTESQSTPTIINTKWKGYYTCSQGQTNLELEILRENNQIIAYFDFNYQNRIKGKYSLIGKYDENSKSLSLTPQKWILQPNGYMMVGLSGFLQNSNTLFKGKMEHPSCGEFYLENMQPQH